MYFFLLIVLPVSLYSSYLPFLLPVSLYSSYLSFLFLFCNIFTSTALPLSISLTHALPLSHSFSLYTPFLIFISWHFPFFLSLALSQFHYYSLFPYPFLSLSLFHPPCFAPYKAWIYMVILNHSPCYGISLFLFNYIFFVRLRIFFHFCYFILNFGKFMQHFPRRSSSRRYPHERDVITRT